MKEDDGVRKLIADFIGTTFNIDGVDYNIGNLIRKKSDSLDKIIFQDPYKTKGDFETELNRIVSERKEAFVKRRELSELIDDITESILMRDLDVGKEELHKSLVKFIKWYNKKR